VPLTLISCTKFTDGVVKLHYAVRKPPWPCAASDER